ncbi:GMC oxidoreductase [Methylobacterium sp. P31]
MSRRTSGCGTSCSRSAPAPTSTRTCSIARSTSAGTCRSAERPIRQEPCDSASTPRPRCSTGTARRMRLDNLYVTDASFFPSIGAVNPTLTIIANALRVADHLVDRMGARDEIPPPRLFDHTEPREPLQA